MSITELSTELLQKIYEYTTVFDLLNLSQTSKRNHRVYLGRRTHLLTQAMHNSFSPLPSLYNLVLATSPDTHRKPLGTELRLNLIVNRIIETRDLPHLSLEILIKMAKFGKTAARWTELYPQIRWRYNSNNRRLLRPHEQERLRGAIYAYWIYNALFHTDAFVRFEPNLPTTVDDLRLRILRTYSTLELIALTEYTNKMRLLVQCDLYPSDSSVRLSYAQPISTHTLSTMGWGSGGKYQSLLLDVMKYDPAEYLYLYEETSTKKERFEFLRLKGSAFWDAPAWGREVLGMVLRERKVGNWFDLVDLVEDEDLRLGVIDFPDNAALGHRDGFPSANDASPDGSFVEVVSLP